MARGSAPNAATRTVVSYLPDPRGGWLFSSLSARIGDGVQKAPPVIERTPTYYGVVARELQRFRGAAGLGAAQIYSPAAAQMNQQRSSTDSATQAVFLSRMARGR